MRWQSPEGAPTWSVGDVVAVRELWRGRVWKARPWIVVQDEPDELVLWIPRGTPTKAPTGSGIPRDEWALLDDVTTRPMLRLARRGDLHSIFHLWRGGELAEWYVNLERPLRRSRLGFDHLDRELDLLARPDGTWEWLDEDEFEAAQALGVIDPVEAGEIRAEGERVVAAWPFPTGWEGWRPDPAWPLPALPAGWDEVVWPVLRTARLELRPLDESDLPWYAALRADPRFSRKSTWRESEESLGRKLSHWAVHGFGGFAVPGDGVIALGYTGSGFEGIEPHEVDLGWFVRAERWGQGIATEAARAVLEFARREEIGPLVVRMAPGNAASRRVAEKLGFVRDGDGRARNGDAVEVYRALS